MSDNPWVASAVLVTPQSLRLEASQLVASITGNPVDALPQTFSIPLTPLSGLGGVTHYGCITRLREQTLAQMPALAISIPGSSWYIISHDWDQPGDPPRLNAWDWLASIGLEIWYEEENI